MRELDLVRWVVERAEDAGDDCAVLECPGWGTLLATTDAVIDGVHLHWDIEGPEAFGYKAVARNLSDIAAMAGEPLWALIAACLPHGVELERAQALFRGAERAGCKVVGGDTAFGPTPSVTATVLGKAHPRGPVLRSGARPGDWIVVTGPLGGSLASGRHYRFRPRIQEARALVELCDVGAMIDISDGLSTDLHHVLAASKVGCLLEAERIPTNDVPLENALHDGEDYELLATVRPGDLPPGVVRIGTVTEAGARLLLGDGREVPLVAAGYEHGA
ncbi:MAG: thiamine-phosphate kinase [Planctomycetota bacterium]|jgi:thiamine-monophosphate kinase